MANISNQQDRRTHPWRTAAISATVGYFGFCLAWAGAIEFFEPQFSELDAHGALRVVEFVFNSLAAGLIGLAVIVGWFFWGAAFLGGRVSALILSRLRAESVWWFLAAGLVLGLLLGAGFAWSWNFPRERWISPLIAGPLSGLLAGLASWICGRTRSP